jgi:acyl-CoA thioester hydrolase
VNNVTYYSWIDTAVNKVLIDSGVLNIRYSRVIGLVVQSQCQYFKPISYPELVQVGVRVGHIGKTSIRYELGIFTDESDTAAAQGHFIHVYVNRGTQQPVSLPIELRHVAESLRTQA